MTYPPPPGGWQDPAGEPPVYIDPISGQPATVAPDPAQQSSPPAPSPYPAYPGYPTDPQQAAQQPIPGYPPAQQQYAQPGYPAYPAYPGYTTPGAGMGQRTNGLAIASLCVSLGGLLFLFCYGGGGVVGVVGAILGHVARRQIAQRGEAGRGMATAGIIIGWITLALGVLVLIGYIAFFSWAAHQDLN